MEKNLVFGKKAFHRLNQLIMPAELKIYFFVVVGVIL